MSAKNTVASRRPSWRAEIGLAIARSTRRGERSAGAGRAPRSRAPGFAGRPQVGQDLLELRVLDAWSRTSRSRSLRSDAAPPRGPPGGGVLGIEGLEEEVVHAGRVIDSIRASRSVKAVRGSAPRPARCRGSGSARCRSSRASLVAHHHATSSRASSSSAAGAVGLEHDAPSRGAPRARRAPAARRRRAGRWRHQARRGAAARLIGRRIVKAAPRPAGSRPDLTAVLGRRSRS